MMSDVLDRLRLAHEAAGCAAMPDGGSVTDYLCDLEDEIKRLRVYAHHMSERYRLYREHHGTEGTYPHPKSVALLDVALNRPAHTESACQK